MNLANKTYKNNITGEIVKIMDSFENIAITEDMKKIDVRDLKDISKYTEEIDPTSFFDTKNAYNNIFETIKTIPTENIIDDSSISGIGGVLQPSTNESAIIMSSEEDEIAELARKYGSDMSFSELSKNKQNDANNSNYDTNPFNQILVNEPNTEVTRIEVGREEHIDNINNINIFNNKQNNQIVEDPIISMFRKTKRNLDLSISLNINEKIPRIDFIEMMEDSYETSIIEFLSNEFTDKLLSNPSIIKNLIKNEINKLVYGDDYQEKILKEEPNIEIINDELVYDNETIDDTNNECSQDYSEIEISEDENNINE